MKPEVKTFARGGTVTKADFWKAFRGERGFVGRPIAEVQSIVGANAPKYWLKQEYLEIYTDRDGADCYKLTAEGREHLMKGIVRHLELHPEDRRGLRHLPAKAAGKAAPKTAAKGAGGGVRRKRRPAKARV